MSKIDKLEDEGAVNGQLRVRLTLNVNKPADVMALKALIARTLEGTTDMTLDRGVTMSGVKVTRVREAV